ncbi:50S ribosomal protein L19 [bacterium]|jgi:large subunit ribosomal protein L19|nr:50S ribosomal protein L19 [bacterium]
MDQVQQLEREAIIENRFPDFRVGDTVRVYVKVIEGNKERIQPFQGICIAKKKGGARESFRVRKISGGIGVERVFPYQSPVLERVEVVQAGKVRRAKLYYLRDRVGKKATKIKQRAIESRKKS